MRKKLSYKNAISELEEIVEGMKEDNTDVDTMIEKVKRASELIKLCKTKLYNTEEEVQKLLDEMENSPSEED